MPARENANSIGHWNPLEAMPTGHDYEVYHLLDENYDLKVTWFSAKYNSDTNMLEYLSIEGYLLGK